MRLARVLAASIALLLVLPASADRRSQKAADAFMDAVALIKKGKYPEAAEKLKFAIKEAPEPNEQQGSESRALAREYDPYYWLGVAQMEMGQYEQALINFEKSETTLPYGGKEPLIKKLKKEYADLQGRKKVLEAKLGGPAVPPTAVIAAKPTTPVVIASVMTPRPTEPPPPPPPTATPFAIVVPTAPPVPGAPTARPTPAESPLLLAVRALKADYDGWLAQPAVGAAAKKELGGHLEKLAGAIASTPPAPDSALKKLLDDEKRYFEKSAAPALKRASLTAGVDALANQRWNDAESYIRLARKAEPKAPQPDLLECTLLATRYVLEGKSDAQKIQAARDRLRDWRTKVGQAKELPQFLSPSLREVLQ